MNIPDPLLPWQMKRSLLSAHKPRRQACSLVINAPLQLPLTPTQPTAATLLAPLKGGKHKEPLQIPRCSGLICIISTSLQVTVAAAPTRLMQMEHRRAISSSTDPISRKDGKGKAAASRVESVSTLPLMRDACFRRSLEAGRALPHLRPASITPVASALVVLRLLVFSGLVAPPSRPAPAS